MMNSASAVVISVPHALCVESRRTVENPCDDVAAPFAKKLQSELRMRGVISTLLLSSIERKQCDLNRVQCRNTEYRQRLTELMETPVFVLDVHSFPAVTSQGRYHAYILLEEWPPPDYVWNYVSTASAVFKQDIPVLRGSPGVNDIIAEAKSKGRPAFLLELNEELMRPPQRQQQLASVTADWLRAAVGTGENDIKF